MWTDPASAEPGPNQGIEWVPWAIVCNYDARDLSVVCRAASDVLACESVHPA